LLRGITCSRTCHVDARTDLNACGSMCSGWEYGGDGYGEGCDMKGFR
jgi:hypothetical protein